MKTIAENANDFVDLRTADGGNCVYVDKTDYFHRLVTAGSKKLFFIVRPRRFGKSLMIMTFKYIFEGRRELFKGLKFAVPQPVELRDPEGRLDIEKGWIWVKVPVSLSEQAKGRPVIWTVTIDR